MTGKLVAGDGSLEIWSHMHVSTSAEMHKPHEQRLVWLRRLVCSTCKTLAGRTSTLDGYIDAKEVQQHVEAVRNQLEPAVSLDEIKEACDIIDTTPTNGGGTLEYREHVGQVTQIKFTDVTAPPPALGEIGSPVPSHSVLAGGFGRPFPGLGPTAF